MKLEDVESLKGAFESLSRELNDTELYIITMVLKGCSDRVLGKIDKTRNL